MSLQKMFIVALAMGLFACGSIYSQNNRDAVSVNCESSCNHQNFGGWARKCQGINSINGTLVWERDIPCTPIAPFECSPCNFVSGTSSHYSYEKEGYFVEIGNTIRCVPGMKKYPGWWNRECSQKTSEEICIEYLSRDPKCLSK